MKKFYITTAIAYPNAKPHIGHALEIIIADTIARMYRMTGKQVEFQTWTDEHGIKNRRTAEKEWKEIHEFLDGNVEWEWWFRDMYSQLKISYDVLIRTSDKEHHYAWAQLLREKMAAKWDIYKQSYKWLYCAWCESFKTEKDLVKNEKWVLVCPDHPNGEIEEVDEENYFFKLSKYKDQVADIIKRDEYLVFPPERKNEILAFLENAKDVSFSRPKTSLPRWVPVPGDEDHVMYVWCDALSNYLTGQWFGLGDERENSRPADLHIVWKDILRFHAAFWPAMLLSADLPLPKQLLSHGFLTLNGKKMSKSTGNVIDPMEPLQKYGRDAMSFNLLYDVPTDWDWDFSMDRLGNVYNSMIIWARWNLVNRVTKLWEKYWINEAKAWDLANWFDEFNINSVWEFVEKNDIRWYLEKWYQLVQKANEFITKQEPWVKYKDEATQWEAIECLQNLLYVVKNLAILSAPVLIDWFDKMKNILWFNLMSGLDSTKNWSFESRKSAFDAQNFNVNLKSEIIYPRIDG